MSPEELHRPPLHQRRRRPPQRRRAGPDHGQRPEHREQRGGARERRLCRCRPPRRSRSPPGRPTRPRRGRGRCRRSVVREQREQAAGAELPRARGRDEVRGGRVRRRQIQRVREAQPRPGRPSRRRAHAAATAGAGGSRQRRAGAAAATPGRTAPRPTATRSAGRRRARSRRRSSRRRRPRAASSATYNVLARISSNHCCQWLAGTSASVASAQNAITNSAAGRIRRARRAQKPASETPERRSISRSRCDVIRNPEITKKTSTPTKPPGSTDGHTWHTTTMATATARSAWISGRMT